MAKDFEYKTKTSGKFTPYKNIDQTPFETDEQYYKRLAKAADQRLRRLEELSKQPDYSNVLQWSYADAMYDLQQLFGQGVTRFDKGLPKTKAGEADQRSYYARLNAVKRFLDSPTSTKGNITAVYEERAETTNRKYGTDLSWQTMAEAFNSRAFEKLEKVFGSKTAVRVIANMQGKRRDETKKTLRDLAKSIDGRKIRSEKGKAKERARIMAEYGLTMEDLYGE